MRKNYFVNEESGFFVKQKRAPNVKMPMNGINFLNFVLNLYLKNFHLKISQY
jgi:hypothetical protein